MRLETLRWPRTQRKKKLGDIFPAADSKIWENYDEMEAAARGGESKGHTLILLLQ